MRDYVAAAAVVFAAACYPAWILFAGGPAAASPPRVQDAGNARTAPFVGPDAGGHLPRLLNPPKTCPGCDY